MKKPFVLFWVLAAALAIFSWVYLPTLSRYHDLKLEQEELDTQIDKLSKDVQAMREERDLLKNDVEYLEKVIRDELGLVKPGEIVYKFVPDTLETVEPEASPSPSPSPEAVKATPKPTPKPPAISVKAKPVASPAPKPKASVKPVTAVKKTVTAVSTVKKPLPSGNAEPSYPRKETR